MELTPETAKLERAKGSWGVGLQAPLDMECSSAIKLLGFMKMDRSEENLLDNFASSMNPFVVQLALYIR
ncbi:hypothetical protein NQZ68_008093 [Dissostichus eleginoides]|nr:hypothetical protein NQZ68_008093 [Dissostichus eleginoides]